MAEFITVSALNKYVKTLLECDDVINGVAVCGEISNFVHHVKTGHFYFALKDSSCSVKAVMFRGDAARLNFMPQTGMSVIVRGRVSLFERDGAFQIYVTDMFMNGEGSIQMAFNALKAKLEAQGLFDTAHKKPIPQMPATVGVVTSKTGAALQDIKNVISRRFPFTRLLLCGATVQGDAAEKELCDAVNALDSSKQADVIIIARGGGSAEDLWVFNSEKLAKTVYACKTPVISAIGHEIDFTILDFVADMRAPTPSAAAELAVPDINVMRQNYAKLCKNIHDIVYINADVCYNNFLKARQNQIFENICRYPQELRQTLDTAAYKISETVKNTADKKKQAFSLAVKVAAALNPYATLARGYTRTSFNSDTVKYDRLPQKGDVVQVKGWGYRMECTVENVVREEVPNE